MTYALLLITALFSQPSKLSGGGSYEGYTEQLMNLLTIAGILQSPPLFNSSLKGIKRQANACYQPTILSNPPGKYIKNKRCRRSPIVT
jgi:hypothetical protein